MLIAGNGGVKKVRRYEDDTDLNGYVVSLQNLDRALKVAVKKGNITIEERTISNFENESFEI